ncbi:MAG: class I SAM-dependent methyltransferase, partial [Pedobacter sp.]|nr:class I SAM-dependent methyltransferase [Pedobacter sp.]
MPTLSLTKSKAGFYENAVLNLISKMDKGSLSLTLPDGQQVHLGDGNSTVKATIVIKDAAFYKNLFLYGDIGFGEGFVNGIWDTDNITDVIKWVLLNIENAPSVSGSKAKTTALNIFKWLNRIYHNSRANTITGSQKNIAEHYDLNNDFFATFLDPTMTYSSGYFKNEAITLQDAQYAKYERLAQQLNLKATDHVLEIGSGWGGNAIYMASTYGCKVTSVTISVEQQKMAMERVAEAGLTDKVEVVI